MLYFTGDICLCDKAFDIGFGVGSQIEKGAIKPFAKLKKKDGDVWVGNFEAVVSDITNRNDYSKTSFRIVPDTFDKSGSIIDYWGVANNHVMEHGGEAYQQMVDVLSMKSNGVFGSVEKKSVCFDHQGKKIAVTGMCLRVEETKNLPLYWHLPDFCDIENEYKNVTGADFKVAYIHWGVEYVNYPCVEQVKFAHWLVDLGYDLIVGMHPHVLQGFEVYKGKHIFYSVGNFVFNMAYEPSKYSALISCVVENKKVGFQYVHIGKDCCPEIVEEEQVPVELRFGTLNKMIGKEKNIEKYISDYKKGLKAYRKSNNMVVMRNVFKFKPSIIMQMLLGFTKRRLHYAH